VTERWDAIVVGAGAMGSATAWWLARRGRSVLLLERFEQGHGRGSSHGGARIFRFAYPDVDYVRLAQQALPLWRELEDEAGVPLVDQLGGVDHGRPDAVQAVADALAAAGTPGEWVPSAEAEERWPGFRFEGPVLFSASGGRCRADDAVRALQDRAAAHGADVRFGEGAESVLAGPGGDEAVVRTAAGEHRAPVAVVTAGSWVAKLLGASVPLPPTVVTREQPVHFPAADPAAEPTWPSFIHHREPWTYGCATPAEGVKVGLHHTGPLVDPDERDFEVDAALVARVVEYVERWLPGLRPEPRFPTTCLYTTTPDEDFVLDRRGPIVVGSPCSGHGFKFTPVIGRILADLADGRPGPGGRFSLPAPAPAAGGR
jgi:sarcosine oxidase